MFQELMPLLSQRVLILTLSRVTDEEICVNNAMADCPITAGS
jgi:hypothetical protein